MSRRRTFRDRPFRQRQFGFLERKVRLERRFKLGIVAMTVAFAAALVGGTADGRYASRWVTNRARWLALRSLGLPVDRAEIEADRRKVRLRDVAHARKVFDGVYRETTPAMRRLLDALGMDPAHALLRWGNYNLTLILPSKLYEADERRSYRMIPHTRSVWLKAIALEKGLSGFFQAPDTPDLPSVVEGTGAFIVPGSLQTTNSWGCRGPEPDPSAPLRGLVLGDSNMQGLFIGDDQTPPEYLRRELERSLKMRVSILNTGHLGYSPEQYYYSLSEYVDRFRPHFLILSFCGNDFGDGEWGEGAYWFDRIYHVCRARGIPCVTIPVPGQDAMMGLRREGDFPGQIVDACRLDSLFYVNPIDDLVDEHLRLVNASERRGGYSSQSLLYNGHISDYHFSPRGAEVWARALARRLLLLFERQGLVERRFRSRVAKTRAAGASDERASHPAHRSR